MNKAAQFNQYADAAIVKRLKEKNQRTVVWVENELLPYLERLAKQGQYHCYLVKRFNHAKDSYCFESIGPKEGVNINLMTESLAEEGFHIEDTSPTYYISWEDKYVY